MCSYLVGGWRRGHEYGQDRLRGMGGLVGRTMPIGSWKIELIGGAMVIV